MKGKPSSNAKVTSKFKEDGRRSWRQERLVRRWPREVLFSASLVEGWRSKKKNNDGGWRRRSLKVGVALG